MGTTRPARPWAALALGLGALSLVASCSSSESSSPPTTTAAIATAANFAGHSATEITTPPAEGNGVVLPQPAAPAPDGYVQEEYFIGGTATSFEPVDTPSDGAWTVTPGPEADYRTRVVVRRPANAEDFSGTVVVEWFNVSAIEASPDWAYLSKEIGREGDAYIGVSAQAQGVEGGDTILNVNVDTSEAAQLGASADASGLKNIDPVRYGTLVHPGDDYSYDIFTQVGRAATEAPDQLLGGLQPKQVIAVGESQSAAFLTTLVDAVHPVEPVFDGFLIHSRASTPAPLQGEFVSSRDVDPSQLKDAAVQIRTDLDVPVMMFETETDLTLLGYAYARQPDTDLVRTWEVAGTSHADAQQMRVILGGPRDPSLGSLVGCSDINTGPQTEVLRAAFHHLVDWTAGGDPPPPGQRIELVPGDQIVIARDDHGNAIGGVRNPLVDVPVATLTGDPPGGASLADLTSGDTSLCVLFGATIPFDQATLVGLYGTPDNYLAQFQASSDQAVAAGFMLQPDADDLLVDAQGYRSLFG